MAGIKDHIKQAVKKQLADRQRRKYYRLLEEKTVTYDTWIRDREKELAAFLPETDSQRDSGIKRVSYEACQAFVTSGAFREETADIVLFSSSDGTVSALAEGLVRNYFALHEEVDLLYGDEDVLSREGIRYTPWLKPDWSPDTFLSGFYFGSIFAVRRKALSALEEEQKQWIGRQDDGTGIRKSVYRLCFAVAANSGGFVKRARKDAGLLFPVGHVDEILFHARRNKGMEQTEKEAVGERTEHPVRQQAGKISVIIPSMDHAGMLKRCILSVQDALSRERDAAPGCEFIVVDNGSGEDTRKELESWLGEQGAQYLYRKMPFHFSRMCNLGAEAASGEVLLFLNDDVEVPSAVSFPGELYRAARRSRTGAVGVKLYYPDSARIQHAGIVNQRLGPVHKLQFREDNISRYYGWNRGNRNVIAVTGACLAVEKRKFAEAGGFPEELPVAFNDVDLCFTLLEKGYYNVVLQDTALYHHESLSRGNDDDREKQTRLLGEKDRLYARHPLLYGRDPFYHKYLAGDMLSTGFELKADYEYKPRKPLGETREADLPEEAREDACVIVSLEYAGTADGFLGEDTGRRGYLIQGYAFVAGSDNACYGKRLLFHREGTAAHRIRDVKPEALIRRDVEENLPDQVNVGMTGFRVELEADALPEGTYRIGVLAKDECSGQKLYSWTNRYLTVDGDSSITGQRTENGK